MFLPLALVARVQEWLRKLWVTVGRIGRLSHLNNTAILSAVPRHISTHRHNHTQQTVAAPEEFLTPSCSPALPLDFTLSCGGSCVLEEASVLFSGYGRSRRVNKIKAFFTAALLRRFRFQRKHKSGCSSNSIPNLILPCFPSASCL